MPEQGGESPPLTPTDGGHCVASWPENLPGDLVAIRASKFRVKLLNVPSSALDTGYNDYSILGQESTRIKQGLACCPADRLNRTTLTLARPAVASTSGRRRRSEVDAAISLSSSASLGRAAGGCLPESCAPRRRYNLAPQALASGSATQPANRVQRER
jgi:hypothetical protein